jgi:transcriptional regulator with XRE-family HTH domain
MRTAGALLVEVRQALGLTLGEVAQRSGTSAPTLSNYERGRKEPRLTTLARILEATGFQLRLELVPAGLDRALTRKDRRSLAMHRLVAARLVTEPDAVRSTANRNLATLRQADTERRAAGYLDEWVHLLDGPTDALVETLTSERQSARDLRQVSPFAGVLSTAERLRIIEAVR